MKTIKQGDQGAEVKSWQDFLVANDFDMGPRGADGDFGFFTRNATERLQEKFHFKVDGVVGPVMWGFSAEHKNGRIGGSEGALIVPAVKASSDFAGLPINATGYQFILDFEVGGGKKYYDSFLQRPTLPGGYSGITIGIGWDLRYNTKADFDRLWEHCLTPEDAALLRSYCGVAVDKYDLQRLRHIIIPWNVAESVYQEDTLPRFWALTRNTFPGVELLCGDGRAAMLSLVFNRGQGLDGAKRVHMQRIRQILLGAKSRGELTHAEILEIAGLFRAMVGLWAGMTIYNGMKRRRNGEADLIMLCA